MKLSELLNGLNKEERATLYSLLKSEFQFIPQLADLKAELNKEQLTVCPQCKSNDIYGHGIYKSKCYHVQHVNSIDNRYERWVKGFYGVAAKYLCNYLNWFVFLEKEKKSLTPITDLAKVITANISAIKNYQTVENRYAKLMIPQCS